MNVFRFFQIRFAAALLVVWSVAHLCAVPISILAAEEGQSAAPGSRHEFTGPVKFTFVGEPGAISVPPSKVFDAESGYGFDLGTNPQSSSRSSASQESGEEVFGQAPFFFSVQLPEGNYDVTVTFGDPKVASSNTVKAESRRLMLERVETTPGEFVSRTFTVNIRTPALAGGGHVGLKSREHGVLHWDDKLTLEFNGARPAVRTIEIAPSPEAVTVFLLGDSTVTDQPHEPWNSWGQMLTRFFQPGVAVANHAESGESLKGSLRARRVRKVLESISPGDYVFIQFGHNDMKDKAVDALEKYRTNLEQVVDEIRARQGTPVLVTSMERRAGVTKPTLARYPQTVRDVAKDMDVPLIDLNAMSLDLYRALGNDLGAAFQDGSHHTAFGSYELARCVVHGIRQGVPELALRLSDDLPDFDPKQPDSPANWNIPASPNVSFTAPDGS